MKASPAPSQMIVCTAKVRSELGERVRFPIMPRALGLLIKIAADQDIVERDSAAPQAERIAELAHSFAHDVLNLAVLASRLLWYEALPPDMTRSPDLVAVGTDTEAQAGMVVGTTPERPTILAICLRDRKIIDARVAAGHEAVLVEFPILIGRRSDTNDRNRRAIRMRSAPRCGSQ
jgi:hypothetical protein